MVAILGAGPIGASIAHRLAERQRVRHVRLIDGSGSAATGKALDIAQSGPVEHFDTTVTASTSVLDAVGADVVIVADEIASGDWDGERGLALMSQLTRAGVSAPIVFAGSRHVWLMERCYLELKIAADRLIGSAPSAIAAAARAWAALEVNQSSAEVSVTGRPARVVIGWAPATVARVNAVMDRTAGRIRLNNS